MTALPIDPCFLGMHVAGDLGDLTIYQTKKGKVVAFPRTKPAKPPSAAQQLQRYRFKRSMETWQELTVDQKLSYEDTTNRLSLCMTGANLWISFCLMHDRPAFVTIQHQTGIVLAPFPLL